MNKIVLIGAVVAAAGIAAGATYFLVAKPEEPPIAEAQVEEPPETFYFPIEPEFIVNFGQDSEMQFLMVDVTVSSIDSKVPAILDTHLPEIRNDLLMLFSGLATENLYSEEGKAELRVSAMENVLNVLVKHYPEGEIDDLFFTRFVMQ